MSTLKVDTISNVAGTSSVPTATVISGSAKAWVNFNGTGTVAIRAAFNVSSITDNGVGDYTLNFTSALPDANYSVSGSSSFADGGGDANGGLVYPSRRSTTPLTTSSVRVNITAASAPGSGSDNPLNTVAVHR